MQFHKQFHPCRAFSIPCQPVITVFTCFSIQNDHMLAHFPHAMHYPFQKLNSPSLHTLASHILHLLRSNLGSKPEKLFHSFSLSVKKSEGGGINLQLGTNSPIPQPYTTTFILTPKTPNTTPFLSILSHFTETISSSPCHIHLHHSWRTTPHLESLHRRPFPSDLQHSFASRGSSS